MLDGVSPRDTDEGKVVRYGFAFLLEDPYEQVGHGFGLDNEAGQRGFFCHQRLECSLGTLHSGLNGQTMEPEARLVKGGGDGLPEPLRVPELFLERPRR